MSRDLLSNLFSRDRVIALDLVKQLPFSTYVVWSSKSVWARVLKFYRNIGQLVPRVSLVDLIMVDFLPLTYPNWQFSTCVVHSSKMVSANVKTLHRNVGQHFKEYSWANLLMDYFNNVMSYFPLLSQNLKFSTCVSIHRCDRIMDNLWKMWKSGVVCVWWTHF